MNEEIPDEIKGLAFVVGDNVDTDVIIPARYLTSMKPEDLAPHAMEDYESDIPFMEDGKCPYKIMVAGRNFGCGSSREHAPVALYEAGVNAVVAPSFARIYYRNSINGGRLILPLESKKDLSQEVETGDELEIDIDGQIIRNLNRGTEYRFKEFRDALREILEAGGLTAFNRRRLGLE